MTDTKPITTSTEGEASSPTATSKYFFRKQNMSIEDSIWFQIEARKRRLFLLFDQVDAHRFTWRANMVWLQAFPSQISTNVSCYMNQSLWHGSQNEREKPAYLPTIQEKENVVVHLRWTLLRHWEAHPDSKVLQRPADRNPNRDWMICSSMSFPTEINPCYNTYWIWAMTIASWYRLCRFLAKNNWCGKRKFWFLVIATMDGRPAVVSSLPPNFHI